MFIGCYLMHDIDIPRSVYVTDQLQYDDFSKY